MSITTVQTEQFITEYFPMIETVETSNAHEVYGFYLSRINQLSKNGIDWQTIFDSIDQQNGGSSEQRYMIANTAARTAILNTDPSVRLPGEIRLHGDGGSFMTINGKGHILGAAHEPSSEVPAHYGIPDPYILRKIGEALMIDKLFSQDADSGNGYQNLIKLSINYGVIKPGSVPHIGMSTLRAEDKPTPNSEASVYTGASGRILTAEARKYISKNHPELAKRMVGEYRHPDDLAGLLDTFSGKVAGRAALFGAGVWTHIVPLPFRHDKKYSRVDLN